MIAGPAPLEGLEIWIGGQGYKLFHEAMTVTQGALSSRWPNTAFGVLQKRLISNTESLINEKREKYSRPLVKGYENMRMILF
jgi:hypothetical protein